MNLSSSSLIYRSFDLKRDLIALVRLLKDVEQTDQIGEDVSEATLREQLTWSGQDPAQNNWVVTQPDIDALFGYSIIQKTSRDENADFHIVVHPSRRYQGIGGQLFASILERAYELDTRSMRVYVDIQNEGASMFVRKHGFEPVSIYTRLSVSAIQTFPAPVLPLGFTIHSYDQIQQVDLYTEAMNLGYEGQWGHLKVTEEEVTKLLLQLNHAGIFFLFAPDGNVIGTCRAGMNEKITIVRGAPTALIDCPGIVPGYRDANLYLSLLLIAIHWLLPQDPTTLELDSWGDEPGTIALYRSLGFKVVKEEISYRLDLK